MAAPQPGEIGDLLYDAYGQIEEAVARRLADAGYGDIRPVHAPAFQAAAATDAPTVSTMAAAAGVTKQHMSQLVLELERLGYVTRAPCEDARKKNVTLTQRGRMATQTAAAATAEVEARWRRELGVRGANSLVSGLRRITAGAS